MRFTAYERTQQGTGASRRLRKADKVPGIVYGAGAPPQPIELDHNALFFALKKEAFHSSILEMELGGRTEQVLLRDYSMHAFRPIVMHVDFQRVGPTTRITKRVPLHFVNEEHSPAVKTEGCLVSHVVSEVAIQCLASQLPEFITVDLGGMTKGQSLHLDDLNLGAGMKAVVVGKPNPVIVTVTTPAAEEEEATAPAAAPAAPAKGAKGAKGGAKEAAPKAAAKEAPKGKEAPKAKEGAAKEPAKKK